MGMGMGMGIEFNVTLRQSHSINHNSREDTEVISKLGKKAVKNNQMLPAIGSIASAKTKKRYFI